MIIKDSSVLITDGAIIRCDNKLYLIAFFVPLRWCNFKKNITSLYDELIIIISDLEDPNSLPPKIGEKSLMIKKRKNT